MCWQGPCDCFRSRSGRSYFTTSNPSSDQNLSLFFTLHFDSMSITLAQMKIGNPSGNVGTSGTIRYYSSLDFTASDGVKYKGGRLDSENFFLSNTWSVSGGELIVPALADFPSTDNGQPSTARVTAAIYDGTQRIGLLFENCIIPANPSGPITLLYLETLKHLPMRVRDTTTLSKPDFQILLNEAINAALAIVGTTSGFIVRTSSHVSFNAAVTAVSALGGGTVLVDNASPVSADVTVDATTELQFAGQGMLTGSSKTVTIAGPLSAPPVPIFASGITVDLAGNTSIPTFYSQWWGVTGDGGTDDTAAMQAFFDEMEDGFFAVLTPRMNIRNTGLTLGPLRNFLLAGQGGSNNNSLGMPTLSYRGTNGGTHLREISCRGCEIRNIYINDRAGGAVTDGPDTSIWFDQDGSGNISSRNKLTGVVISGPNRAGYKLFKVDNTSGTNNEQHIFDGVLGTSYGYDTGFGLEVGTAVYLGHSNVKEVDIRNCAFLGFAKGIEGVGNPSFYSTNNNYSLTAAAFSGNFSDPVTSINDHGEGVTQIVDGAFNAPFTMLGARFDDLRGGQAVTATTSDAPVFSIGGSDLDIRDSQFSSASTFTSDFLINTSPGNGNLTWRHNKTNVISLTDLAAGLNSGFRVLDTDVYTGSANSGVFALLGTNTTLNGTTPDLRDGPFGIGYSTRYGFNNGGTPTTVTNFINGFDGQIIILVGDAVTTLANGATIKTISGANITPWTSAKIVMLFNDAGIWRQIGGVQ